MEPITLCGAVIVAFGLWVELEPAIMKAARTISRYSVLSAKILSPKVQRGSGFISPSSRNCRAGSGLSY